MSNSPIHKNGEGPAACRIRVLRFASAAPSPASYQAFIRTLTAQGDRAIPQINDAHYMEANRLHFAATQSKNNGQPSEAANLFERAAHSFELAGQPAMRDACTEAVEACRKQLQE